jgi:hypothetical protein
MYAKGHRVLIDSILKIYKCIDFNDFDNGDYTTIRKRLACVYSCNAYNYIEIGRKLDAIMLECKRAKLKHYYGMVHYYYAVYYSITQNFPQRYFSQYFISSGAEYHIYEAKERQFNLAYQFVG